MEGGFKKGLSVKSVAGSKVSCPDRRACGIQAEIHPGVDKQGIRNDLKRVPATGSTGLQAPLLSLNQRLCENIKEASSVLGPIYLVRSLARYTMLLLNSLSPQGEKPGSVV